jgi:ribosomal protein S18 acetylase RimI-like enzyme
MNEDPRQVTAVGQPAADGRTIGRVIERARTAERAGRVAEAVMRALPEWFGLEEPLLGYVEAAKTLPTLIASEAERDVGFLTIKQHTAGAAEIVAMGVLPDRHRRGIGRALVEAAAADMAAEGTRLLQVKTLGPAHPSLRYARTRSFYEALGFIAMEETTAVWGEANPCLIMVKALA